MTIYSTGNIFNQGLRYRIEMRKASDGAWQQRHIWLAGSVSHGVVTNEEWAEEWISTPRGIGERFAQQYAQS